MFKKLRSWVRGRASIIRFYLTVMFFVLILGFLFTISLGAQGFSENLALNLLTEIVGALLVIYLLEGYLKRSSKKMHRELELLGQPWDDQLLAWDNDRISWDRASQSTQWLSWDKWTRQGNVTGWFELWEAARYGVGLSPRVRWAVEWELENVRRQAYQTGVFSDEQEELEEKLQALLQVPSRSTVNPVEPDKGLAESSFNDRHRLEMLGALGITIFGMMCALAGIRSFIVSRQVQGK